MVSENLEQVKANIEAACKRVGRNRSWSGYLRGKQGSGNV